MVILCDSDLEFQSKLPDTLETHFQFELSPFQNWAIYGLLNNGHVLVTAHTGSGKTVPAEFAINHFTSIGKKVIYTTPIKALSNQKMHEFTRKFPDISVGLLTGDCKCNPDADVLIMTTEILRNHLFNCKILNKENQGPLDFTIDLENELGCVVFDEVHYIADPERGSVWEQSILLLPDHIPMVMLSATIHKPEVFASWVEEKKKKTVYVCATNKRVVPLIHYSYITMPNSNLEMIMDKKMKLELENNINRFSILKSGPEFKDIHYDKMKKCVDYFEKNNIRVPRKFVMNTLWKDLKKQNMLPALCFVFSRKQVEICASEVSQSLFDEHDTTPSIIKHECKQLLVSRFKNWREYVNLPEFEKIISLMEKGVAIHHAGILPIFREMVELMYDKKYIKLLFATETFAVGLNMPTKTVVFSSVYKYNGVTMRELFSNEYTQMAGRAGRRGIDTIGHVIHCNNLFEIPPCSNYKKILNGEPPVLKSKFKINYNLVLSILNSEDFKESQSLEKLTSFVEKSMMQSDINAGITCALTNVNELEEKYKKQLYYVEHLKTPKETLETYHKCKYIGEYTNQKKKKEQQRMARKYEIDYRTIKEDYECFLELDKIQKNIEKEKQLGHYAKAFVETNIQHIINILMEREFITSDWNLTNKGILATYMHEVHCLVFADLYTNTNGFNDCSAEELCGLFSCFSDIKVSDDVVCYHFQYSKESFKNTVHSLKTLHDIYYDMEVKREIDTCSSYKYQYDIIHFSIEWFNAEDEETCKLILNKVKKNKDIFMGDFIKALLKINHIVTEMEKVAGILNNMELLQKLRAVQEKTMKFVATTQSLYI